MGLSDAKADTDPSGQPPASGLPRCERCGQYVKPKVPGGWSGLFGWLALCELVAAVIAVVQLFHPIREDAGGPVARLVMWPAAVHPGWLAVLAAVAAFLLLAVFAGAASGRAKRRAVCPNCDAPMPVLD